MFESILNMVPIAIHGTFALLLRTDRVRFGSGLGDILFHMIIWLILVGYTVYFFFCLFKGNYEYQITIPIISLIIAGFLLLKMTIWRGREYSWDGYFLTATNEEESNKRKRVKLKKKLEHGISLVNSDPENSESRLKLGGVYYQMGLYKEAIDEYEKAYDLDKENKYLFNRIEWLKEKYLAG